MARIFQINRDFVLANSTQEAAEYSDTSLDYDYKDALVYSIEVFDAENIKLVEDWVHCKTLQELATLVEKEHGVPALICATRDVEPLGI